MPSQGSVCTTFRNQLACKGRDPADPHDRRRPLTTWTAFRMRDPQAMTSANLPISKAPSRMRDGAHFLYLQYNAQLLRVCMRADDGQHEPLALEDVFGDALDIFCGDLVDSLERFIERTDTPDMDER